MGRCHAAQGLTLLELLIALAIGSALLLVAVPSYRAWVADLEMRDRIEALVVTMNLARAEAIKRQSRVALCASPDGARCGTAGRWEDGWILFADANDDGERDADEPVLLVEPRSRPGITIRGNKPVSQYVSWTSYGHARMTNGALQMGTFTVCRPGAKTVNVILANGGRVRVDRTKGACRSRRKVAGSRKSARRRVRRVPQAIDARRQTTPAVHSPSRATGQPPFGGRGGSHTIPIATKGSSTNETNRQPPTRVHAHRDDDRRGNRRDPRSGRTSLLPGHHQAGQAGGRRRAPRRLPHAAGEMVPG
jgi:type IV fimbrial biogenesis protein FimT